MLRGLAERDTSVRLRYQGAGTAYKPVRTGAWPATKLDNYYVEISFPERGMRVDTTVGKVRQVKVVAGDIAWDESGLTIDGPPVGKTQKLAADAVRSRQLEMALTPYAAIKAAHANVSRVTVTPLEHGTFLLTFPSGDNIFRVTLDRNRRPARVETDIVDPVLGKTTMSAEYSGYKDYEPIDKRLSDEPYSDFFFPEHITYKLGGKTTLDLKVTTCWCVNPYVVFPTPGQFAKK